jgi:hypothetical protein
MGGAGDSLGVLSSGDGHAADLAISPSPGFMFLHTLSSNSRFPITRSRERRERYFGCIRRTYPHPATLRAPPSSADGAAMQKKPRRRETPAPAANDNKPGVRPLLRYVWSVYRTAARARWVGQVVAADGDEAIEAAAVEFGTDAWKLIAVRRYEIARA